MPLVASRSFAPHGMPCSGPVYLPALISRVGLRRLRERQIFGQRDDAIQLRRRTSSADRRYIFVSSVDETSRRWIERRQRRDRQEREICRARTTGAAGGLSVTLIFAPGVRRPFGFLPGRYG